MASQWSDWKSIPGNWRAADEFLTVLRTKSAVAFVGAGASAPNYPLWTDFLKQVIEQAIRDGSLPEAQRPISRAELPKRRPTSQRNSNIG